MKTVKFLTHRADARLYFRECYGRRIDKGGKETYFQYHQNDSDTIYGYRITANGENESTITSDYWDQLDFPTIDTGYRNISDGKGPNRVLYLERSPIRQFAWGFNTNSYETSSPDTDVALKLSIPSIRTMKYSTLRSIFNPIYYTVAEAISQILSGAALSVALDEDTCLSLKWGLDNIAIYHHSLLVGRVIDGVAVLYHDAAFVFEQISQHFNVVKVEETSDVAI